MRTRVVVTLEPYGKRVEVEPGATILQVATSAGIGIRSECGGRGLCGKCRVIVQRREAVDEVKDAEKRLLSDSELRTGYRLACQTRILGEVVVVIPQESRLGFGKFVATGLGRRVELKPAVRKLRVVLPKPTLEDARPDLDRLLSALREAYGIERLDVDYEVLKRLPSALREADWDVAVVIWDSRRIVGVERGDIPRRILGLAVDLGTSKIVGHLVDLELGEVLAVEFTENPQVAYGEDVVTRITFASSGSRNLRELQRLAVEGLNEVLRRACRRAGVDPSSVYEIVVVGNTAMHHFLLGIQPRYLALSPFTPALKDRFSVSARELGIEANPGAVVTALPVIAGFVGADAVADVLATGIHERDELSLLMDIGTNTEIILGSSGDLLSCSAPSGPAFEGAHIRDGMRATTGAIESIRIGPDYEVEYLSLIHI